jgi:hypothetical protein
MGRRARAEDGTTGDYDARIPLSVGERRVLVAIAAERGQTIAQYVRDLIHTDALETFGPAKWSRIFEGEGEAEG